MYLSQSSLQIKFWWIRLLLTVSDIFPTDVTQAYLQIDKELKRDICFRAPKEPNLDRGLLLKLLKPRYELSESEDYRGRIFTHHMEKI